MKRKPSSPNRPVVWAATLTAGALIAQQVAGKAVRDALFLSSFNVKALPSVMIGSAVLGIVAVLAFSRAMALASPARAVPVAVAASGSLFIVEWAVSLTSPRAAAVAVYLHMAVFGATVVSGFWSLVNERFDPYTAKRVVGFIGMGASLGGVAGGVLAFAGAGLVQVPTMLAVMAATNALCLAGLTRMRPKHRPEARAGDPPRGSRRALDPLAGIRILGEVPYLRDLALLVGLGALVETLLDYALNAAAARTFAGGGELMSFFALFHTGVGLLALLIQTLLSRRCLQAVGLAGTVAFQPAAAVIGSVVALFSPRLVGAVIVRGAEAVLHNSLFRSGYELFYTPLPGERKRPTKAIVDVGFDKLGTVLGGLITLLLVSVVPSLTHSALLVTAGVVAAAALGVSRRLHFGYVSALGESLRSGALHLELGEVEDSTTRVTLAQTHLALDRALLLEQIRQLRGDTSGPSEAEPDTGTRALALGDASHPHTAGDARLLTDPVLRGIAALRSGDIGLIRRTLAAQADSDPEGVPPLALELVPHLIPLLALNEVFLDVLRALRRVAPRVTGQLLDALLDLEDPAVRRRIPRVLKACATQRVADGLLLGLADERFDVRYQCGAALSRVKEKNPVLVIPDRAVFAAVLQELKADAPTERVLEHIFTLLALVLEAEPLRISFWALRSEGAIRGTALEYLENVLPETIREALWPHLKARRGVVSTPRPAQALRDELLRSSDTIARSRVPRK